MRSNARANRRSDEVIGLDGDPDVKGAALIAAAQRVEHYDIAGYGCARAFARRLGNTQVAPFYKKLSMKKRMPTKSSPTSRKAP
jgi:ferritin-like metal-binding protein YciE